MFNAGKRKEIYLGKTAECLSAVLSNLLSQGHVTISIQFCPVCLPEELAVTSHAA